MMSNEFSGRVALVTGASRGIGRAIALELASRGATLYINYSSSEDSAKEVLSRCLEFGCEASLLKFSVADSNAVNEAFSLIKSEKGKLDILVNNAGITKDGLLVRFKNEDWEDTLNVNLSGTFYCSRAAAKLMIKSKYGRIINMSSVVALMGNVGQTAYVASKAGIVGLTKALARELASRNITVNCIAPGFIETDMTANLPEDVRKGHLEMVPLGRYGTTEEVAKLTAFLCTESAGYITGQVISINGGMYL